MRNKTNMIKVAGLVFFVFGLAVALKSFAIIGPGSAGGVGSGLIVVEPSGSGNLGIGTSDTTSKFIIKSGGTTSGTFGLRVTDSGNNNLLVVRSDGAVAITTTTYAGGRICFGAIGVTTDCASTWSGLGGGGVTSTPAGYITPGYFNSIAGTGGNYSFPASLSIGTSTASAYKLFVNGETKFNSSVFIVPAGAPLGGYFGNAQMFDTDEIGFYEGGGDGVIASYGGVSQIYRYGQGVLAINGNNVGIGTSTPAASLDVRTVDVGTETKTVLGIFGRTGGSGVQQEERAGGIVFSDGNSPTFTAGVAGIRQSPGSDYNGALGFYVSNDGGSSVSTLSGLSEAMRISNVGYVGIGTAASILTSLHVAKNETYSDAQQAQLYLTGTTDNNIRLEIGMDTTSKFGFIQATQVGTAVKKLALNPLGGNVGIGTTTPANSLSVVGNIQIASSTGGLIFRDGTTQTTAASGSGGWTSTSTGIFYNAGNVGIGTATPSELIHAQIISDVSYGGGTSTFQFGGYAGIGDGGMLNINLDKGEFSNNIQIFANPEEGIQLVNGSSMYINTGAISFISPITYFSGKVGIGTLDSTNALGFGSTQDQKIWIINTNNTVAGKALTVAAGGTYTGGTADMAGGELILQAGLGKGTGASTISFQNGTTLGTGSTLQTTSTKMTILGNGNVGIGTTAPIYPLEVAFSNTTDPTSGSSKGITLTNTDITTNSLGVILFRGYDDGSVARHSGAIEMGKESAWVSGSGSYPGFLSFWTRPAAANEFERMRITSAGNVGIGTTTPAGALSVVGTSYFSGTMTIGGGTGKINVGTVDPPYTIGGEHYATYLPGMTGQKEETTGEVNVLCHPERSEGSPSCFTIIDFNKVEKGSDLWLFSRTADLRKHLGDMTVLLTPSFDGKVWYEKDAKNLTLTIYGIPTTYHLLPTTYSISYRLTSPRFDTEKWTNAGDSTTPGFIIPDWSK